MRTLFALVALAAITGCGGKVESTDSADGTPSTEGECNYGALGSVGGLVTVMESNGNSVFYATVVDQNHSSVGVLSADQTTSTLWSDKNAGATDLALYEDGVAAVIIDDVGTLGTRGTEIRFWNGEKAPQTVETLDGTSASFISLTTDSDGNLVWYKYDSNNGGGSFETWNEGPTKSVAAPADYLGFEFAADGGSYFGIFGSPPALNFGQLNVNGAYELPFSSFVANDLSIHIIGIDAKNVYYTDEFAVPETPTGPLGSILSADRSTGQTVDLSTKSGVEFDQPAVVRQGALYSLNFGGAGTPLLSRYTIATGETTVLVSSSATQGPGLITQDRCGIVYAVAQGTTTEIFRIEP